MSRRKRTLLLTGGSGVIGRAFIDSYAAEFDIVALLGSRVVGDPRVREFAGDFTHPTLGLDAADHARLVREVDVVLHLAAITKWSTDPGELKAVNLQGTDAMLRFAAAAGAPLYYVSTAFVVRTPPSDERFAGLAAYLESKVAAEEQLRASSVPTVILRPSVVTGDSADGRMSAFQGLHRVLGGMVRGTVPVLPAELGSRVDTVPQDVVVDAIAGLVRDRVDSGEYWLTAGHHALSVGQLVGLSEEVSSLARIGATRPRLMALESVDRLLLPLLDDFLSDAQRREFIDFLESAWAFQSEEILPSDLARLGLGDRVGRDALVEATRRSLLYWAQTKGLLMEVAS